ncbi:site-specific integrase [Pseudomonas neustonica]|uniref:Site-specific integrase n=1 Tax=Pseudomonas neustonica TaxID=2487346 RepID=A0ABX9XL52_9PSED|nr:MULTISPECIES: site-specific integrase [Pseudomonas]ROZ81923.1 site-specific integrase [Pseudomonas sp. SSM44]ROZ83803.1 site-specific integrase [Pseudomonas neustonica]
MNYKVKHFVTYDGERFSQLYDAEEGGFPLYYPTSYIARSVRSRATHKTQQVHLEAVKRVCEWEAQQNIRLALRFPSRQFLQQFEIDSLVKHLVSSRSGRDWDVICRDKANTYIAYAARYLRWLACEVIGEIGADVKAAIDEQHHSLISAVARKSGSSSASKQRISVMQLPNETTQALFELFKNPLNGVKKEGDQGPRMRNVVMLRILYETGMRRGELLSLKLANFVEAIAGESARLRIERNHHDKLDSRVHQPVAKTLGRIVNISAETEQQLIRYRDKWRPSDGSDFLFLNHRGGRFQSNPVTETGFNSALDKLKEAFPALEPLHPHLLRHDWNYRFSKLADKEGLEFETERTMREMLMGWKPNSNMSLLYNQRHIQERVNDIGRELASDTMHRGQKKWP